jgi:hypothetical protein
MAERGEEWKTVHRENRQWSGRVLGWMSGHRSLLRPLVLDLR